MDTNEFEAYCINKNANTISLNQNFVNFTHDFFIRAFELGCFFIDYNTGYWSSYGVNVSRDSNLAFTVCETYHLTSFAGGLVVLPPAINFQEVWANISITQNPTIYATVIAISVLFILLGVFAFYMDNKDKKKLGINLLSDNYPTHNYCYEIVVFTGNRYN